jgi:hypothetical protein
MIEKMYGYFPGGTYDPRKFKPDREVNTPAEIEAWEHLCAAWNAGCASVTFRSGLQVDGAFRCGSALGMGTYEVEMPDGPTNGGEGEPVPVVWERSA